VAGEKLVHTNVPNNLIGSPGYASPAGLSHVMAKYGLSTTLSRSQFLYTQSTTLTVLYRGAFRIPNNPQELERRLLEQQKRCKHLEEASRASGVVEAERVRNLEERLKL
jgi:uncharacterized protein YaiL (DUF2058 family)